MILVLGAALAFSSLAGDAFAFSNPAEDANRPYTGLEAREIASLSRHDVAALMAGEGWGLALPAELNGYPGPDHVLELADELSLTDAQRDGIEAIRAEMRAEAKALGRDYVDSERRLSEMFSAGRIEPAILDRQLERSSRLLARLRSAHLNAHLATAPLLTGEQRETYARLRGYAAGGSHGGHAGHGGHGH